jgi:hypothetical protein
MCAAHEQVLYTNTSQLETASDDGGMFREEKSVYFIDIKNKFFKIKSIIFMYF